MRLAIPILSGTLLLLSLAVFSQEKKSFTGLILDKSTGKEVRVASIRNINLGITSVSRNNGTFELTGALGHIIAFAANGYYADTITITAELFEKGSLLLNILPLPSTLTNVTVVGNYTPYQLDSMERRKRFLEDVGEKPLPTVSKATDMGFGVGINLGRWSKKERNERKARTLFDMMEEESYVNARWNEEMLKKYVTYRDEDLILFMEHNRPTYEWLRRHTDEESMLYYINSSLKKEKRKYNH